MNCQKFEIGHLQAFVDGELREDQTEAVIRHLGSCEVCSDVVSILEVENEFAFAELDTELNPLVPTERLREKVFTSINGIEESRGYFGRGLRLLGLSGLLSQPAYGLGLLLAIGAALFALGFPYKIFAPDSTSPVSTPTIANEIEVATGTPAAKVEDPAPAIEPIVPETADSDARTVPVSESGYRSGPRFQRAVSSIRFSERPVAVRASTASRKTSAPGVAVPAYDFEAEEGYLKTISTLSKTVNESKDYVLRPNERVSFERNLAVVNDAIVKLTNEVKKDPGNTAARTVLRNSYESKIELLNSVANKSEDRGAFD
ncbi:MAG: anti-sigma factor [Pyrinomonadaceae bacterium]